MKDLSEQLKELSDKGIIRPSFLTMGSSGPIRQNKDESFRMCIDYREINKLTFSSESCDPVDTPMVEKSKLDEDKEGKAIAPSHYCSMIGTLLYLTANRPDLQFAICICARYQAWPTEKHVHALLQMRITLVAKILAGEHLEVCNFWERDLLAGHQRGKRALLFPVWKLNT
nr:retrotransposon protein, putative, unclassified [Tanacetum cinerariifolium]